MDEKTKVYLDTNIILDVFINHAKALKTKEQRILPRKYKFLLENKEKVAFVTSFITKAEASRELSAGFGLKRGEIESLWDNFIESLDCRFVSSFTFDTKISDIAATGMKIRTLFNFMHLLIAIAEKCYFVSGDKDLIEKMNNRHMNVAVSFPCSGVIHMVESKIPPMQAERSSAMHLHDKSLSILNMKIRMLAVYDKVADYRQLRKLIEGAI